MSVVSFTETLFMALNSLTCSHTGLAYPVSNPGSLCYFSFKKYTLKAYPIPRTEEAALSRPSRVCNVQELRFECWAEIVGFMVHWGALSCELGFAGKQSCLDSGPQRSGFLVGKCQRS